MDERLRKKIYAFYFGGVVNAFFGLYILIERPAILDPGTALWIALAFIAFALVDFVMPMYLKRQWQARRAARASAANEPGRPA